MIVHATLLCIILFTFLNVCPGQLKTTSLKVYSRNVKDSFTIKISIAEAAGKTGYSTVYYLDADRKSGKDLRALLSDKSTASRLTNTIFIGIAQTQASGKLRSRDFIPPLIQNGRVIQSSQINRAHADRFYNFLTKELIPLIDKKYNVNKSRTLIGHSLGGLFVFYSLFKNDHLFKNYISLSPALWANRFNIFKYEEQYHLNYQQHDGYLYFSTGRREIFNLILPGTRRMKKLLDQRKYAGMLVEYFEHKGKKHFTQIPVSLAYILRHTTF